MEEYDKSIRVLIARYNANIQHQEIPLFRGAIIASVGNDENLLYHNHIDNQTLRYKYPLIQYKRIEGKAAIVYINEACELLKRHLSMDEMRLSLGTKTITTRLENVAADEVWMNTTNKYIRYEVRSWIPFNSENHDTYTHLIGLIDKLSLLQKILTGNILSMAKGLGITIEDNLDVVITNIEKTFVVKNKGIELLAFNVSFIANIVLPEYVGIGKAVSKGNGTIINLSK